MRKCALCGNPIENNQAEFCPHCGTKQRRRNWFQAPSEGRLQLVLLIIMAILIIALTVQNYRLNSTVTRLLSERTVTATTDVHGRKTPSSGATSAPSDRFSHTDMILSGMLCPCKGCEGQTVLDCACNKGNCAEKIRNEILAKVEQGERVGTIFDWFVSKYGEKFLTEESRQIRQMRDR